MLQCYEQYHFFNTLKLVLNRQTHTQTDMSTYRAAFCRLNKRRANPLDPNDDETEGEEIHDDLNRPLPEL